MQRYVFPSPFFLQLTSFTLTSITASFGTQLWDVLLKISYCTLVISFPCTYRIFLERALRFFPMNSVPLSTKH